jgi:hypothetical protein
MAEIRKARLSIFSIADWNDPAVAGNLVIGDNGIYEVAVGVHGSGAVDIRVADGLTGKKWADLPTSDMTLEKLKPLLDGTYQRQLVAGAGISINTSNPNAPVISMNLGTSQHNNFGGRSAADAHPQEAITGLVERLASDEAGLAGETARATGAETALDTKIDAEAEARNEAIAAHNTSAAAHADVREDIQAVSNDVEANYVKQSYALDKSDNPTHNLLKAITIHEDTSSTVSVEAWSRDMSGQNDSDIGQVVPLPLATATTAGIMPGASFAQIEDNTSDIAALKGANKRRPTQTALPETLEQTQVQAAWEAAGGSATPVDGDTIISFNTSTMDYAWKYFSSDSTWHFRGVDTASMATNTTIGLVKGDASTDGKVFVENDGSMSLNGYDTLSTGVENNTAAIAGKQDEIPASTNGYVATHSGTQGTFGTPVAVDATGGGTASSNSLITSGAVNAGLANKLDRSAGTGSNATILSIIPGVFMVSNTGNNLTTQINLKSDGATLACFESGSTWKIFINPNGVFIINPDGIQSFIATIANLTSVYDSLNSRKISHDDTENSINSIAFIDALPQTPELHTLYLIEE